MMGEICKYSLKPTDQCKNKCGGCKSHVAVDGEWVQPVRKGYKLECCDCGLVHTLDFRIRRGKIQFRAERDNRRTAARRNQREELRGILAGLDDMRKGRTRPLSEIKGDYLQKSGGKSIFTELGKHQRAPQKESKP